MTEVFVTTYEIVGSGIALAKAHVEAQKDAQRRCLEIAHGLGADGYRPGHNGELWSLLFKDGKLRKGLRRVTPRNQAAGTDFVPRKDKSGEPWREGVKNAPTAPMNTVLARQFGWDNDYGVTDGYSVFHSTLSHLQLPVERFFLRLPRQVDDGYVVPGTLREVSEGELMRAIADHNDAVRAHKKVEVSDA